MLTLEQLKANCECVSDMNSDEFDNVFAKFIRFLSNITCWDIKDGTILKEKRVQTIEIKECDKCYFVQPYYKNIDFATFKASLRTYTSEGVTILPVGDANYDEYEDLFILNVPSCCNCKTCNCCERMVLVLEYEAGYDLESPEWLDIICHYFTAYIAMANQCFTLNDCCRNNETMLAARLKTKKVGEISYTWDIDKDTEEYLFKQIVKNYYTRLLSKYALCGREYIFDENIWIGKAN